MLAKSMGLQQQFREVGRQSGRKIPQNTYWAVFTQPIVTPTQAARTLGVHYSAATKYLNQLTELELVEASELVKHHLHSNRRFIALFGRA